MKFNHEFNAKYIIVSDIFFITAPLIIYFLVKANEGEILEFFKSPDIGYANIVLFGQTLVRFVSGIAKTNKKLSWQLISLLLTLIIVLGLFPSAVILMISLSNKYNSNLYLFQWTLFVFAITIYFIVGSIGQMYLEED
ncbi:conserved membrane hypothetical protein [Leptospira interrogans serovar Manilae]|uniref:Uncharacterized protein n=1 Tax=Leptospira interrogans serovar Manilae TaxID=214675 RepID=A0AAQ1NZI0_LEPIR|nr:hypothetical protein [Leptospira interrogans]AKP25236.1 hypothetical protein LIMLP_04220 [Leptospira interrogans serovar Manilae]AKP29019.1 hypothetical protein LIMHP_04205 [Leptospira interrogans serovar Manilae]EYU62242.1 hypothetical protein CI00_00700 [Leptospira interrogans serovar Manilae]SOR61634.1 conserved membrane hypothetical protein [Leptospira interrogans serovar Manilae]